jgi:hypothetical protein
LFQWSSARRAALLLAFVGLPACSNMALPNQEVPASGPAPGYEMLVVNRIESTFKNLSPNDPVEISQPRWVETFIGWNWLICVQLQDQGHRRTYALFMNGSAIIDARYAVQTDACGAQTYSALDLPSGAIGSAATGGQGPLY